MELLKQYPMKQKKQEGEQPNSTYIALLLDYCAKRLDTFFIYSQKDNERYE